MAWMNAAAIMQPLLSERNGKTVIHHLLCCINNTTTTLLCSALKQPWQVTTDSWAKTFELRLSDEYLLILTQKKFQYEIAH